MILEKKIKLGKLTLSLSTLIAALLIIAGAGIRLALILGGFPTTNSDEATVGLMALHISQVHDFPAFLYGQASLGALEAYMGAVLFFIFGPTTFALRLGLLLFFIAFLVCMYVMTRQLYSKGLALVTLALLGVGTPEIFYRSIPAFAGHAETPLFGALIMLLSTRLGLASQAYGVRSNTRLTKRFVLFYLLWGLVAGLAFWNDALAASFIVAGALFILVCCHNTLKLSTITALFSGFIIGILPLILNDVLVQGGEKSVGVLGFLGGDAAVASHSIFEHFAAAFLVSLPVASGGTGICTIANYQNDAWPITSHSSSQVIACTALHGVWAAVMVAAWLAAVILELGILSRPWLLERAKRRSIDTPTSLEQRARVLHYARLMLLGSAALTWLVFTLSASPILFPWADHRYLIGLAVATPAVAWPLWKAITSRIGRPLQLSPTLLSKAVSVLVLLVFAGALINGTFETFEQTAPSAVQAQDQQEMTDTLVRLHIRHIYSEYWTCDLVSFLSKEQVVCSVLFPNLTPGFNRYVPYATIVAQDPKASYFFPIQSQQAQTFAARVAHSSQRYSVMEFDNYILYQPIRPGSVF